MEQPIRPAQGLQTDAAAVQELHGDAVFPVTDRPVCEDRGSEFGAAVQALDRTRMGPPTLDDRAREFVVTARDQRFRIGASAIGGPRRIRPRSMDTYDSEGCQASGCAERALQGHCRTAATTARGRTAQQRRSRYGARHIQTDSAELATPLQSTQHGDAHACRAANPRQQVSAGTAALVPRVTGVLRGTDAYGDKHAPDACCCAAVSLPRWPTPHRRGGTRLRPN